MGRESCGLVVHHLDANEERFYVVMHHLATVLWMKGVTIEALAALCGVLEEAGERKNEGPVNEPFTSDPSPETGDESVNSPDKGPLVQAGDMVRIPEAHYLYGVGVLVMRVTTVGADLDKYPSLEWVGVKGIETDCEGGERTVLVRVTALNQPGIVERPADGNST